MLYTDRTSRGDVTRRTQQKLTSRHAALLSPLSCFLVTQQHISVVQKNNTNAAPSFVFACRVHMARLLDLPYDVIVLLLSLCPSGAMAETCRVLARALAGHRMWLDFQIPRLGCRPVVPRLPSCLRILRIDIPYGLCPVRVGLCGCTVPTLRFGFGFPQPVP